MTYKEAAGQLRDLMQDWKLLMTDEEYEHSDIYKHDIEALQFGINAIEQMEKGDTANWIICSDGYYPFCANYFKNPKTGLVCLTYNPYQSTEMLEVSHPENPFDDERKSVYEWAKENGLYAELYDYSWYFPGAACFVVISASPGSVIVPKPIYVQHDRTFTCPDCGSKWYGEWYYFCPHCGRDFSMEERENHICGGKSDNE